MTVAERPTYLPRELADEIRRWAPPEMTSDELWRLQRIQEQVYARGFDDGHRAGFDEGYDYHKRPNSNDVNRLREAIAAAANTGASP